MAIFAFKIRPQILLFKAAEPQVKISQISKRAKRFAANRGCEAAEGASCRQTRSRAIGSVESKSTRGWHQQTTNNCPQLHSVGASDDAAMCSHTHNWSAWSDWPLCVSVSVCGVCLKGKKKSTKKKREKENERIRLVIYGGKITVFSPSSPPLPPPLPLIVKWAHTFIWE